MFKAAVMSTMAIGACFFGFFSRTNGARIGLHKSEMHQSKPSLSQTTFHKDKSSFVCMQKWQKSGDIATNKFCLVDLRQILDAAVNGVSSKSYRMMFSKRWGACQSKKSYAMKVCNLKGNDHNKRISYGSRVYVPKACFWINNGAFYPKENHSIDAFVAAVATSRCEEIITNRGNGRGKFAPAPVIVRRQLEVAAPKFELRPLEEVLPIEDAEFDDAVEDDHQSDRHSDADEVLLPKDEDVETKLVGNSASEDGRTEEKDQVLASEDAVVPSVDVEGFDADMALALENAVREDESLDVGDVDEDAALEEDESEEYTDDGLLQMDDTTVSSIVDFLKKMETKKMIGKQD